MRYRAPVAVGTLMLLALLAGWLAMSIKPSGKPLRDGPEIGKGLPVKDVPVVIGPVDVNRGIPAVVTLGLKRSQVLARLGHPISPRTTLTAASRQGRIVIDERDVNADFFLGSFTWVTYDPSDRVSEIRFSFRDYPKLKLVLMVPKGWLVVDRSFSSEKMLLALKRHGVKASMTAVWQVTGGSFSFTFSPDGHALENLVVAST